MGARDEQNWDETPRMLRADVNNILKRLESLEDRRDEVQVLRQSVQTQARVVSDMNTRLSNVQHIADGSEIADLQTKQRHLAHDVDSILEINRSIMARLDAMEAADKDHSKRLKVLERVDANHNLRLLTLENQEQCDEPVSAHEKIEELEAEVERLTNAINNPDRSAPWNREWEVVGFTSTGESFPRSVSIGKSTRCSYPSREYIRQDVAQAKQDSAYERGIADGMRRAHKCEYGPEGCARGRLEGRLQSLYRMRDWAETRQRRLRIVHADDIVRMLNEWIQAEDVGEPKP